MSDFEGPALLENDALVDISDTRGGYSTTVGTFRVQVSEVCTSPDDKMDKSVLGEPSSCKEKRMSNGDIYIGSWKSGLPDGLGKYLWLDGCMYEGDWVSGKATGRGKISWPSGATYEGEFSGGFIQGVGTLIGVSNTTYKGSWVMNVAHGLGRKWYSNGDVYEGLWKQGVQDGPGRYTWRNGDVYFGNWKRGLISGYGSLTWANRDSYHGQWLNGLKHGQGTYVWADGSCYIGTWSMGLKDGKGIFYPPGMRPSRHLSFSSYGGRRPHEETENYEPLSIGENEVIPFSYNTRWKSLERTALYPLKKSESMPSQHSVLQRRWSLEGPAEGLHLGKGVHNRVEQGPSADNDGQVEGNTLPILEREYAQGVLISELVKDGLDFTTIRSALHWQQTEPMDFKRLGETIIKGHRSYDLMLNLQLGIRYSVGRSIQGPECDLEPDHFSPKARLHVKFPSKGSQSTPPHHSVDFRWTDYCPVVFRKIRKMFKIEVADYIISICGSDALRELSSPGKSGSVFYLSNDDRYMIKTLRRSEVRVLLKMLPNYYKHICKHDNTLITKFFGLHQVTPRGGQKIRVVVMGNIFCTELRIHRRFDLKGSWQGRSTDKVEIDETTVLKDLDLDFTFYLEPSWRQALFEQIHKDCSFLESQRIMDYSLLLGLHFRAPPVSKSAKSQTSDQEGSIQQHDAMPSIQEDQIYPNSMALVAHEYKEENLLGPHVRGSPLRAATAGHEEVDLMILGSNSRLRVQLGVNMPAKAVRKPQIAAEGYGDDFLEVYDVILYFGVIDILQEYTVAKRIEHVYKSLKFHSDSISAVNPQLYSQRFQDFLHKIFTCHC